MDYKPHPYAELFPMMGQKELASLAKDIAENGQRDAIVLDEDDLILDGRNRLKACAMAEVEPWIESFRGGNKLAFVISKNMERRHLDDSQRALIAARIETAKHGAPEGNSRAAKTEMQNCISESQVTRAEAAEMMNVSPRLVASAHKVEESGADELRAAVASGEVSVSDAAAIVDQPKSVQKKAVKAKRDGKATTVKKAAAEIAPPAEPRKPKNGSAIDTTHCDKKIKKAIGEVMRGFDDRAKAVGGQGPFHKQCLDSITETSRLFNAWKDAKGKR